MAKLVNVIFYKCEKCGELYKNLSAAEDCCKVWVCEECGKEAQRFYRTCEKCSIVKKYNKAKKVKYSEYKGEMLWSEEKQRYFRDKEELMEQYESDAYDLNTELSYPKWCFGCFSEVFQVNMDSAVESAIDETFEGFDRETHIVDLDELENFMDKWNKKQVTRTYFMDYATVILLDE